MRSGFDSPEISAICVPQAFSSSNFLCCARQNTKNAVRIGRLQSNYKMLNEERWRRANAPKMLDVPYGIMVHSICSPNGTHASGVLICDTQRMTDRRTSMYGSQFSPEARRRRAYRDQLNPLEARRRRAYRDQLNPLEARRRRAYRAYWVYRANRTEACLPRRRRSVRSVDPSRDIS